VQIFIIADGGLVDQVIGQLDEESRKL